MHTRTRMPTCSDVTIFQSQLADASARKGGGLKLRHILEMTVHAFARLGQKGVSEQLAGMEEGEESEGMMRLQVCMILCLLSVFMTIVRLTCILQDFVCVSGEAD